MLAKHTSPWSPCRAICPTLYLANLGHLANLLLATRRFQSSLPISYSQYFTPFIQCSTCGPSQTSLTWFHWPTGLVASSGLPVLGSMRRLVEGVGPAGLLRVALRVGVVEDLELHAGKRGPGLVLADAVHDAAVGVRRDLVVQFQHEVVVLRRW